MNIDRFLDQTVESRQWLYLGMLSLLVIGFYYFFVQILNPPIYDALQYFNLANEYNNLGILGSKQAWRTFAYPWLLSWVLNLSDLLNIPHQILVFFSQLFFYYLAILSVVYGLNYYSKRLATVVYLVLCTNIFIAPYLSVTLTDSLYTTLSLLLIAWLLHSEIGISDRTKVLPRWWIFAGIVTICLAITIRPAAIWLIAPVLFSLGRLVYYRKIPIIHVLITTAFAAWPLYIQMTINAYHYQDITFLPVVDLGDFQIRYGIENIKYATWLGGGSAKNFYPSGITGTVDELTLNWYFTHLFLAIKLVALKLVGAFDFDYLVPYPYEQELIPWLASIFSLTLLYTGLFTVIRHLFFHPYTVLGPRLLPLLFFLAWSSVNLVSALELRFTLPLVCYFILISVVMIYTSFENKDTITLKWLGLGWLLSFPLLIWMAYFIRCQSVVNF